MSPPSFSPETGQVLSVYGLAFSGFFASLLSAASAASGAARYAAMSTAAVIGLSSFIGLFCYVADIIRYRVQNHSKYFIACRGDGKALRYSRTSYRRKAVLSANKKRL